MKKKKFSLVQLSKKEIAEATAGYRFECDEDKCCGCGCNWADAGGSCTVDNMHANYTSDLSSPIW